MAFVSLQRVEMGDDSKLVSINVSAVKFLEQAQNGCTVVHFIDNSKITVRGEMSELNPKFLTA